MERADGPYLWDADGKRYIDLIGCWGPAILGHRPPEVIQALTEQLTRGLGFGTCSALETELAEQVLSMLPGMEKIRFVNSGTEATMSALRLARGVTGRDKLIKFCGCYHGHGDSFLIQAGSGALTHGAPSSLGVPAGVAQDTLVASYNKTEEVAALFEHYGNQIAAVILEPVAGNMGVVPPAPGFLEAMRSLCDRYGALLIFDEVMTGFRVARGGATERFGIRPDLVTLGKIIGGGLPVGAYTGRAELMDQVSPLGKVYQAGTLSGNPMAMSAGLAQLKALDNTAPWQKLEENTRFLCDSLRKSAAEAKIPVQINQIGSMFTIFFTNRPVLDTDSALAADTALYARFFHSMLRCGVYLAPSQYEALFLSTRHNREILAEIAQIARQAFDNLV
jgi:glutamate-1-semialdehyde 2,1-aminomutase